FQGGGRLPTAVRTFVGDASVIEASAGRSGDGGKVIVWADDLTRYSGSIRAAGGSASGDGGFVEVSGKQKLDFRGAVDVAAAHGTGGTLLLDPTDIVLSTAADSNTTGFTAGTDNTEAFAEDSGQTSTFDVSSGGSFSGVSSGSTILLQATNDITVSSLFDLTTATGNSGVSLELNAKNHIDVNAPLKTDGAGTLTLVADSDTSGTGTLTLGSGGGLVTQSGTITLKGADFVMSSPAAGDIQTDSGTLILAPLMSTTVGLGAQTGTFGLSNAEIAAMTVSDLIVGDAAVNATLTADDLDV
ncbi:MAG: hypothetical protein GWN71_02875, partial [Gammaproteobacteria bacterium]|nr:hypothetical protein [Gemmatimonadota bacterium]NIU72551.1 hypothetical protein [Gammaproteobacteria bacterium]